MTAVLLTAFVLSLAGVAFVLPFLRRAQVMDVPNKRSSHQAPTPRGGGIAVVAAMILSNLVGWALGFDVAWAVLAGVAIVAGIGFLDDLRGLDVGIRLSLQLLLSATASLVILGSTDLPPLVIPLATVALAGYTNAFNFMDGVNSISAINAALAGGWFGFLGVTYSSESLVALGAAIAGASLGFLPWNAPRARVFLGDVGSYGLGFAVGASALVAWSTGVPLLLALAPLAVYGADTAWALVKRVWGRRPWQEAHREHVYQRLTDIGWSHTAVAAVVAAVSAVACAAAAMSDHRGVTLMLLLGIVGTYLALPNLLERRKGIA